MVKVMEGQLLGKDRRFAIVVSRFNDFISRRLMDGAVDALARHGVPDDNVEVYWVPGSFEIPLLAQKAAKSGKYDAVICLGAVIRGATPHFDQVAGQVSRGVAQTSLETGVPVIFGVVTADTLEQAIERAGTKAGNRGWDAAMSAMEMADLIGQIGG